MIQISSEVFLFAILTGACAYFASQTREGQSVRPVPLWALLALLAGVELAWYGHILHISNERFLFASLAVVGAACLTRESASLRCVSLSMLAAVCASITVGVYFHRVVHEQYLSGLKATIALTAAALSMYEGWCASRKTPIPPRFVKGVACALAVLSVAGYFRFGDLGYSQFYHRWEFYHYYLGSKYDRELEYERLYKCTAVAQADLGQQNEVKARKLRDLSEDAIEPSQPTLDHPEQCRSRFTAERWEAFKADVKWFRASSNLQYWNDMQKDHGYNPPPVWTIAGHLLSSLHPASDVFFKMLALFDPLFFIGTFAAVWWAFGWRVCCAALILWGCQLPAEYFWTGGAFLRQDWIFLLVLSACFTRKRYFMLAGAAFAYATLLRVFPGVMLGGWLVVAGSYFWRKKRFSPDHLRVAAGGILASLILVTASIGVAGKDAYPAFWKHIQVHNATPLTNHMGLKTIIAHGFDGRMEFTRDEKLLDPFLTWKQMRRDRFQAFFPLYMVTILAIVLGFTYVVRRVRSLWIAQALSLVLVISLVELTCYYYSFFILAALLSRVKRGFEQGAFLVAGASQLLIGNPLISYYYDDRYTAQSILFFGFSVALVLAFWPARKLATSPVTTGEHRAGAAKDQTERGNSAVPTS